MSHDNLPPTRQKDYGPCQKLLDLMEQDEDADPAPCKDAGSFSLVNQTYDAEPDVKCPSCERSWKQNLDTAWENVCDQYGRHHKDSELLQLKQQRERLFQSEDMDKAYYDKIERAQRALVKKFELYRKARGRGSKQHGSEPSTSLDDIGEGDEDE